MDGRGGKTGPTSKEGDGEGGKGKGENGKKREEGNEREGTPQGWLTPPCSKS